MQCADIAYCKAGNKQSMRHPRIAYQDFVIVLPGVVNDLPQYFENFCFGKKSTEANRQITIDYSPVEHLQPKQRDTAF